MAVMILAGAASFAHASQGVFGAWWDANDTHDDGLGVGYRLNIPVVPRASFDTRFSWIKFSDDDMSVFPIEAGGMLKLGMVYAGAGFGYYFFDVSRHEEPGVPNQGSGIRIERLEDDFGWYLLTGIDIPAGSVGIFGEAKWIQLSPDGIVGGSSTTVSLDGIGVNVGVMFAIPGE
jgi:hypothetical protein